MSVKGVEFDGKLEENRFLGMSRKFWVDEFETRPENGSKGDEVTMSKGSPRDMYVRRLTLE